MLSIVIPFLDEEHVLPVCVARLFPILESLKRPYEVIFVDDGSTDGSVPYLIGRVRRHPQIRVVRLSRNFGKEAAMTAGLAQAAGEAVIILDADLQDPPELIPKMVNAWLEGADVVSMRRNSRGGDSLFKRLTAYLFYRTLNRLSRSTIPADTGDFRLISRRALDALLEFPERCRYMKGLYAWVGMRTVVLEYSREERVAGKTKWHYFDLAALAAEGLTSFSTAPLRWAMGAGVIVTLLGGVLGLSILVKTLIGGGSGPGYLPLIAVIMFLGGIQLLAIGLLGIYVGKTYIESKQRPIYLIQEVVDSNTEVADLHLA